MGKSYRDQRSRPHSGKNCPEAQGGGCAYCRTGEYKTIDNRRERHGKYGKKRAIQLSLQEGRLA